MELPAKLIAKYRSPLELTGDVSGQEITSDDKVVSQSDDRVATVFDV
jgi:hypothetical protein